MSANSPHCLHVHNGDDIKITNRDVLPYKHLKNLGVGGSAVVEMVQDKWTGQVFAHKIFRRYFGRDISKFKQQVQNEIDIIRRLSACPHIVRIFATYSCGREVGLLLTPVADSGDLGNYLQAILDTGDQPTQEQEKTLTRAFGCLAGGLDFIHKQTIRHKDIKPQNILIHQGSVVYTDFGIALDGSQDDQTTTVGTALSLTYRYCAPEVAKSMQRNRKSDIFSLGCVYAEILSVLDLSLDYDCFENVPYHLVVEELQAALDQRRELNQKRGGIFGICVEMVESDPASRISIEVLMHDLYLVAREIASTTDYFCEYCEDRIEDKTDQSRERVSYNKNIAWADIEGLDELKAPDEHSFNIFESRPSPVKVVALSPDSKLVASTSPDGIVWLRDLPTRTQRGMLKGHTKPVNSVVFSSDGKLVVSGSDDGTVRLWDLSSTAHCSIMKGHGCQVKAVVFSPDETLIASTSEDGVVLLWEKATSVLHSRLEGHSASVSSVAFSSDAMTIVSATEHGTVWVRDTATGALHHEFEGFSVWVNAVAFSLDGRLAAFACPDKTVRIKHAKNGAPQGHFEGHSDWIRAVALSGDGKLMASATIDGIVWLWDTESKALITKFTGHSRTVNVVVFSSSSKLLVSASDDGTVRLWNII
ncbi:hypothetical protein ACMFMG_007577 [Clarireedia jacksonii]